MNEDRLKQRVQRWIFCGSALILIGKFIAFFLTNSVGILTDAMESIVNVVAGAISLYSLHLAAKPKDEEHPFGHGKVELISASIEGLLIMMAGGVIIYEGVRRLFSPSEIGQLDIGIAVVAVAGVLNYLMGWYSVRMGKRHNSMVLVAGGKHLQSDTYSTIGLVLGLLLLYWTKIMWIDSALALIFGSIIILTGISILRRTVGGLMDEADKAFLEEMLQKLTQNMRPEWIDVHNMRVIKSGSSFYIDCDLTLPWYFNIRQGHEACDELKHTFSNGSAERITLLIHTDACNEQHCEHCAMRDCPYRKQPFQAPLTYTLKELTETDEQRKE